ncbi:CBS domain-containing protein [Acuticoccus sp.]|uniref:CBS domain-containing protein n=1 Tax=Acuticoccus sp. TaxID=1904378 RepID=UPI003B52ED11
MTVNAILQSKGADVFTMGPHATLREVASELTRRKIGAVLILEDEELRGIISERDIVRGVAEKGADALAQSAASTMTRALETCGRHDAIDDVMHRMTVSRFRHMPVIEDGRLIGLVSIGDVVKRRIEDTVRESDDMRAYIHSS